MCPRAGFTLRASAKCCATSNHTAELISEDGSFEEGAEGNDPGEVLRWLLDSSPSEQSEQQ